ANKRYIENVYTFTNNDSSSHEYPLVWGREQWIGTDTFTNDEGRYAGDTVDVSPETHVAISSLDEPWMTSYDTGVYAAMGLCFQESDPARYGYFLTAPAIGSPAVVEWVNQGAEYRPDDNDAGSNANNTFFDKVWPSVAANASTTFTFWQWGYDSTSWANIESAISADCAALNPTNQNPSVSNVSLNGGNDIYLTENATYTVSVVATTTDADAYTDLSSIIGRIYRSGVTSTEACTLDNNNCYQSTCATSSCSGNDCQATCDFDVYFHAEPTSTSTAWADEQWVGWIKAIDSFASSSSATNTAEEVDVMELLGIDISDTTINYGKLVEGEDTVNTNIPSSIINTGNSSLDIETNSSNMVFGATGTIPVYYQKFSVTSTTPYGSGTAASTSVQEIELDIPKTTSTSSRQTKSIYWGLGIPIDTPLGNYYGTTSFSAKLNELPW
ncbi:MAG: hypothetical protein ABIA11_00055, partial [Patescibacteria group bacterium]